VTDRKRYKELMKYLKKISKYPDGQKKAQHIAEEWKLVYKRRPAMMDELQKMGF
jgi:DNA anti-recombination protein RmuC